MEKISGILPASARTKVADISASQPARPGAPAFGRPMGKNSLGDRITLSRELEELRQSGQFPEPEAPPTYTSSGEVKKLKVIDELNKKFFTNPKEIARDEDITKSEETLRKTNSNEGLFVVEKELKPQETARPVP